MKTFRVIISVSLVIPAGMIISSLFNPIAPGSNSTLEYLYLLIGLPIILLNLLAWFYPEYLNGLFDKINDLERPVFALPTFPSWWLPAALFGIFIFGISLGVGVASAYKADDPKAASVSQRDAPESASAPITVPNNAPALSPVHGTPVPAVSTPTIPSFTPTARPSARCAPAAQVFLDILTRSISARNPADRLGTGMMIKSADRGNLYFVAAKINRANAGSAVASSIALWAAFTYPDKPFELFSMNPAALEGSDLPVETNSPFETNMQNDGALDVYNCVLNGD